MSDQGAIACVIDTDPGLDDAIALWLALASPELHILAILATSGNVDLARTLANARAIVGLSGRSVAVHAGADRRPPVPASTTVRAHGEGGLGPVRLPPGPPAAPGSASDALRHILRTNARTTMIGLGPVTNLALALAAEPMLARRVEAVVLMAGGTDIEFNARTDPEALAILLAAGPLLTFATLDLTAQALLTPTELASLRRRPGGRCLAAAVDLLAAIPPAGDAGRPVHDACAVAWLLRPDLFTAETCHACVLLDGDQRGRTIFAPADRDHPANARLLRTIDRGGFLGLLADRLASLP